MINLESVESHDCELGRVWRVEFDDCCCSRPVYLDDALDSWVAFDELFEHQLAEIRLQVLNLNVSTWANFCFLGCFLLISNLLVLQGLSFKPFLFEHLFSLVLLLQLLLLVFLFKQCLLLFQEHLSLMQSLLSIAVLTLLSSLGNHLLEGDIVRIVEVWIEIGLSFLVLSSSLITH